MKKKINIITLFILTIFLCYNIVLTVLFTNYKNKIYTLYSKNAELKTNIDYQDHFINQNNKYFNISQKDILTNIGNDRLDKITDSLFFVIIIPSNVCEACLTSMFVEIKSTDISLGNFFTISENNEIIRQKQWLSNGFPKTNFIVDRLNMFKNNLLDHEIVIFKVSRDLEHFYFIGYEAGYDSYLRNFIAYTHQ